jgi:hypothetical protein
MDRGLSYRGAFVLFFASDPTRNAHCQGPLYHRLSIHIQVLWFSSISWRLLRETSGILSLINRVCLLLPKKKKTFFVFYNPSHFFKFYLFTPLNFRNFLERRKKKKKKKTILSKPSPITFPLHLYFSSLKDILDIIGGCLICYGVIKTLNIGYFCNFVFL